MLMLNWCEMFRSLVTDVQTGVVVQISNINKPDDDEAWEGHSVTVWAQARLSGPPWEQETRQTDQGGGQVVISSLPSRHWRFPR